MNESRDGRVLKSNVEAIINAHIRAYIIDKDKSEIAFALYKLLDAIDDMPVQEASWIRDDDGAWRCSHCGYRFFNGIGSWHNHCVGCGYTMI